MRSRSCGRKSYQSNVVRDGQSSVVLSQQVVPGDVVLLSAGSLIPADGVVIEANDLFVNQAVLTGEVFPVEKKPGIVEANASLMERVNCVFMGTSVRSGTGRVLVVQTAKATVFGQIAERLKLRPPETEFERGVHDYYSHSRHAGNGRRCPGGQHPPRQAGGGLVALCAGSGRGSDA
jgi:Mg2+-importing ATPase